MGSHITDQTMNTNLLSVVFLVASVSSYPFAFPDGPGGSYAGDNHFQYINVPAPAAFEWDYRRGNPDHNREDHTFKAKWHDGYEGHGEHYWDYNHIGPKEPAYAPPKPSYAPLRRQARQVEEPDSFQSPHSTSNSNAYGAPHAAGPDHVDYGAYTGGYGAFGWYTDHPVLLGPGGHY